MDLSLSQLAWLHDELGTSVADEELQERFERRGSVRDVAIEVWRARRAKLLAAPLAANVSGVASVNYQGNVEQMSKRIDALSSADTDPSDDSSPADDSGAQPMQVVQLVRTRGR